MKSEQEIRERLEALQQEATVGATGYNHEKAVTQRTLEWVLNDE